MLRQKMLTIDSTRRNDDLDYEDAETLRLFRLIYSHSNDDEVLVVKVS
jgi:hypothetical protein